MKIWPKLWYFGIFCPASATQYSNPGDIKLVSIYHWPTVTCQIWARQGLCTCCRFCSSSAMLMVSSCLLNRLCCFFVWMNFPKKRRKSHLYCLFNELSFLFEIFILWVQYSLTLRNCYTIWLYKPLYLRGLSLLFMLSDDHFISLILTVVSAVLAVSLLYGTIRVSISLLLHCDI